MKPAGVVVPHKLRWRGQVAAAGIYAMIRAVAGTLRYRLTDQAGFFAERAPSNVIFCTWHNRLALSLHIYNLYLWRKEPQRRLAAIVSASRDGAFLARILEHFGVQPVRGSTSRRGPQALLELTTWAERGYDLAITPDGPRGPRYVIQPGVMSLAQLTGLSIIPVTYSLNCKSRLNTWDQFQVPWPFAICQVHLGEPVRVPREASDEQREILRVQFEKRLLSQTVD